MYTNDRGTYHLYQGTKSELSSMLGQSSILKERDTFRLRILQNSLGNSPASSPCEYMKTPIVLGAF